MNRIEPWRERVGLFDVRSPFHPSPARPKTKGTTVVYDGDKLRAKGGYEDDVAAALIGTFDRHAVAEGIFDRSGDEQ